MSENNFSGLDDNDDQTSPVHNYRNIDLIPVPFVSQTRVHDSAKMTQISHVHSC